MRSSANLINRGRRTLDPCCPLREPPVRRPIAATPRLLALMTRTQQRHQWVNAPVVPAAANPCPCPFRNFWPLASATCPFELEHASAAVRRLAQFRAASRNSPRAEVLCRGLGL